MRIMHYSLGFPPYRTGGLTKFCMDLMTTQRKQGHAVALLWPGEIKLIDRKIRIRKRKITRGISSYEIINPLPISYDEGIKDFTVYEQQGDKNIYARFLEVIKPDVIHVHTLMGLHKSFLIAAKEKGIRLVFTTHDFFPICPKVTMFRDGKVCDSAMLCEKCGVCNNTALGLTKIQILQSPLYRSVKDCGIVKKIRKRHRDEYLSATCHNDTVVGTDVEFKELRKHYYSMLRLMDVIHCNSSATRDIYADFFKNLNYKILPISHADISDHRKKKVYDNNTIRIRYLGPQSAAKGYYLLKEALDELWKDRKDFVLDIHFTPNDISEYMSCHGRYEYGELQCIFDNTDVLICPSIWYETFGFTVLEALSYGVPVIISDHVGAKDILQDDCGVIVDIENSIGLKNAINSLTIQRLKEINENIVHYQHITDMHQFEDRMENECYSGQ